MKYDSLNYPFHNHQTTMGELDFEGVITLNSGLQYKVLKQGKGNRHPTVDSKCSCHYEGKLIDGTVFDSSYERGQPTDFAPNQVGGC